MYIEYDDGYQYQCELCEKQVDYNIILKCDICGIKLCHDCNKAGICLKHYNLLSDKGKQEYDKYLKRYKEIDKNYFYICIILTGIFCLFPLMIFALGGMGFFNASIILFVIFLIIWFSLGFLMIVSYIYLKKKMKLFKEDRLRIYKEYCTNPDERL